jgi:hypothetical protein
VDALPRFRERAGDDEALTGEASAGFFDRCGGRPQPQATAQALDLLAVVRIIQESPDAARDDGADFFDAFQLFGGGVDQRIDASILLRQNQRQAFAHVTNPQAIQEAFECGAAGVLDGP